MKLRYTIPVIILAFLLGFSIFENQPTEEAATPFGVAAQPAGLHTYFLGSSGVSQTGTSITLTSLTLPQNDYPIQDSDLADTFYLTLEPGSRDRQEFVSCTTVGSNTGGNVTLSGCTRGLSPIAPYTASTTLQFAHSAGSRVIFSDPPQLFEQYAAKDNDETVTGYWNFTGELPTNSKTATTSDQFANKAYVDSVANAGAATSTETNGGIVELATQIEMASSTDGGVAVPRVLYSKYSTSTPDGTSQAGLYTVISENDGKLSQLWYDLTETWNFTGSLGISSSTPWARVGISHEAGEIPFAVGSSTATRIMVDADGNIGIGTTSPSATLSVGGNILVGSGGITFDDGTTQTTAFSTYSCQVTTFDRNAGSGTGTVAVAHNLGKTPTTIRVYTNWGENAGTGSGITVTGIATSTDVTQSYGFLFGDSGGGSFQGFASGNGTGSVINLNGHGVATISAIDSTNVTFNWTTGVTGASAEVVLETCG